MSDKPKRAPSEWVKFTTQYYKDHKDKFNKSFKEMLKSNELKEAYKNRGASGGMVIPKGGMVKKTKGKK